LRALWSRLDRAQQVTALACASALALATALALARGSRGVSPPTRPNVIVLIDAESRKCREVPLAPGMGAFPMKNPDTGRSTLWPAEFCFSKPCAARGGTPVLLNDYLDRPGPTHCPRCGARVVMFNGPPPEVYFPTTQEASHVAGRLQTPRR
jgi:hypothetical protein